MTSIFIKWRYKLDRTQKTDVIRQLREKLSDASLVIVTQQSGLTADQVFSFRTEIRQGGAEYKVAKNSLIKLAITETIYEGLNAYLKGVTALAYSKDPIAAAKISVQYAKKNENFKIICGVLNGEFLDKDAVQELAGLPSLDGLRSKIVGLLQAPATRLIHTLQAAGSNIVQGLSAFNEKNND